MSLQRPICVSPLTGLRRGLCSSSRRRRGRSAVWSSCGARSISGAPPALEGAGEPMKCCTGALSLM
eukprot:8017073-Lingulodinium_polyedra.AAC.1